MGKFVGFLLRSGATTLYFLEFLASATILGIFSYFLAKNNEADLPIAIWMRAVDGLAGSATLYTLLAILLTFFLGGIIFFAFIAIVLDILFIGAFIFVAVETRGAARNCNTVTNQAFFGNGATGVGNTSATPVQICKLEETVFILAIILCFLFFCSAILQLVLGRHAKKEKRYGPGPSNNYTSGTGKRSRFGRGKKGMVADDPVDTHTRDTRDVELGTTGLATSTAAADIRPSADTAVTDTAYGGPENKYFNKTSNRNSNPTGYVEPATQNNLEQNLARGPDVQTQYAFDNPAIHTEPAVHGLSRYEAEKYGERQVTMKE